MGDSLHARGALPAHSETFLLLLFCLLFTTSQKEKKVFSGMRTEYDPSA
jgi:hypothetical protein